MTGSHVFGPVPSRRLGRSLGLDLVPFKTCTYDCVYCQLGRTTNHTLERREYVPAEAVLRELGEALAGGCAPDYITLSGSGEPTLYEPLGALIRAIKALSDVPVAVLTNGSLLRLPEVRTGLAEADLVVPSLDAGDEACFRRVNRPPPDLSFAQMTAGLEAFAREFRGRLWLEVFLLAGLTATAEQVGKIREIVGRVQPERVQLNTVARPPAETWAQAASAEELAAAQRILGERCEIVADYPRAGAAALPRAGEQAVLEMLRRRPCRLEDLAAGLGQHRNEAVKHVEHLLRAGTIRTEGTGAQAYYNVVRSAGEHR